MRWVAFLRGMNVGGHRITNDDLCGCFADLGFEDVWAYQASGNVAFETSSRSRVKVAKQIEVGLRSALEYEVPTFLRSGPEVAALAEADPFGTRAGASGGKLQVAMLLKAPTPTQRKKALAFASDDDQLAIDGEELYWLPKGGLSVSELDVRGVEKAVGTMTVRTHATLARLANKLPG